MPDGRNVMFGSNRQGTKGIGGLYMRRADGTGEDSLLRRAQAGIFEAAWSPDRTWLLFRTGGTIGLSGGRDIVGLRPGIDSAPVPVVATRYDEEAIAISPNGRWLAYESNETGRTEIFVRPFPNTQAGKRQVSNGGGVAPLWSRNGRELFYLSPARDMMAVSVAGTDEPQLGERQALFHLDDRIYMTKAEFYTPYDVAPDGRFIMARNVTEASKIEVPLIVVENWFEEVRQKTGR
jgi:Tol biopolymer transport system component